MAKIVLGMGSSHGPMLSTPPQEWGQRVLADRKNRHPFRGKTWSFDELVALRKGEELQKQIEPGLARAIPRAARRWAAR